MRVKLANYVAGLLAQNGITQCFSVTGKVSRELAAGFQREPGIDLAYLQGEAACAYAASGYAKVYNKPAAVLVDSCPGGAGILPGVLAAWNASVPMLVLTAQVRSDHTARWSGVGIRKMEDAEFDVTRSADPVTKYAKFLTDPSQIRAELEKCIYLSQTGRPGPVWLDIPEDFAQLDIDEAELESFDYDYQEDKKEKMLDAIDELEEAAHSIPSYGFTGEELSDPLLNVSFMKQKWQTGYERLTKDSPVVSEILDRLQNAKRPILYTGGGIRTGGCEDLFLKVADRLGVPVVVSMNSQDVFPTEHPLMAGRPGEGGDRPGKLAVENADVIFAIGARLGLKQVGSHYSAWARDAYTIVCDIDEEELKKPTVFVNLPVHADAGELLRAMIDLLNERRITGHDFAYNDIDTLTEEGYPDGGNFLFSGGSLNDLSWRQTCALRMEQFPSGEEAEEEKEPRAVGRTCFYNTLSRLLPPETIITAGADTAETVMDPLWYVNSGTRILYESSCGGRGAELGMAIGAYTACHAKAGETGRRGPEERIREQRLLDKAKAIGELDRARKNPWWKGRHEIYPAYYDHDVICVSTAASLFAGLGELETLVSGTMPLKLFVLNPAEYAGFERIAAAFGLPYCRADREEELEQVLDEALNTEGPVLCEVAVL